jgi:RNA polymerase sigma-70 factor, ECF subfamily
MTDVPGPVLVEIRDAGPTHALGRNASVADAFLTYSPQLYNFLRRSTRDASSAEDLLQETFLRLTNEVAAGRHPREMRAWLYRVASNLAISRARRRATVVDWMMRHAKEAVSRTSGSPESDFLEREHASSLDTALGTIATEARTALLMSADGFTGEEIALVIGRSHAATRTLLSRARVRLRVELDQHGELR